MVITTFFSLCTLELVHISTSSALHPLVFPLTCTYIYSTFIHIDILTVTMYPEVMEWLPQFHRVKSQEAESLDDINLDGRIMLKRGQD